MLCYLVSKLRKIFFVIDEFSQNLMLLSKKSLYTMANNTNARVSVWPTLGYKIGCNCNQFYQLYRNV